MYVTRNLARVDDRVDTFSNNTARAWHTPVSGARSGKGKNRQRSGADKIGRTHFIVSIRYFQERLLVDLDRRLVHRKTGGTRRLIPSQQNGRSGGPVLGNSRCSYRRRTSTTGNNKGGDLETIERDIDPPRSVPTGKTVLHRHEQVDNHCSGRKMSLERPPLPSPRQSLERPDSSRVMARDGCAVFHISLAVAQLCGRRPCSV